MSLWCVVLGVSRHLPDQAFPFASLTFSLLLDHCEANPSLKPSDPHNYPDTEGTIFMWYMKTRRVPTGSVTHPRRHRLTAELGQTVRNRQGTSWEELLWQSPSAQTSSHPEPSFYLHSAAAASDLWCLFIKNSSTPEMRLGKVIFSSAQEQWSAIVPSHCSYYHLVSMIKSAASPGLGSSVPS